jgi:hypothetical protein
MKLLDGWTIGADPEFLVATDTEIVPITGYIGGTKDEPIPVSRGGLQEDNVMLEINIDPVSCKKDLINNMLEVKRQATERLERHGLHITPLTSARFKPEYLDTDSAKQFGCLPDYDAWEMRQNPTIDLSDTDLRMCGGHIHVGMPEQYHNIDSFSRFVKLMDLRVGMPLAYVDGDTERYKYYGKAGNHRPKPYGIEYRTPSNWWAHDEGRIGWVFDLVQDTIQHFVAGDVVMFDIPKNYINEKHSFRKQMKEAINILQIPEQA